MDVTKHLGLEGLVEKIERASPIDPPTAKPLLDPAGWTGQDSEPTKTLFIDGNRIVIDPGPHTQVSLDYQRWRTGMWNTYTVSADLVFEDAGVMTGLTAFSGNTAHRVVAAFTPGSCEVTIGDASEPAASSSDLPDVAPVTYHVEIAVNPKAATVTVDGVQLAALPLPKAGPRRATGGIGIVSHRLSDTAPVSIVDNLAIN
jgi:hypothetical protein